VPLGKRMWTLLKEEADFIPILNFLSFTGTWLGRGTCVEEALPPARQEAHSAP
jgi:hypothetical protein